MARQETDEGILGRITKLVEEERALYSDSKIDDQERERLQALRVELDQCWDLLRQRRALREFGEDPDAAKLRSPDIIENYEQ